MIGDPEGKLTFRAIEVFAAVVEQGGIVAAARQLAASASTVSHQLSNLENALGTKLVERSAQRFARQKRYRCRRWRSPAYEV